MSVRFFVSSVLSEEHKRDLHNVGVEGVDFSLIKTERVPFSLKNDLWDYAVFSSKNGVRHFFSDVLPDTLKDVTVVAVGKSTAKALQGLGFNPVIPHNFSGEGLVELFKQADLEGKRFLVVRPEKGRKVFVQFLRERGAEVEEVVVYRTVVNEEVAGVLEKELKKGFDFVSFTSPSNFKAFLSLGKELAKRVLKEAKVIPIGHVTADAVRKAGFSVYKMPEEYTLNGIVKLILEEVSNAYG
ncbi:uroporphyrinogen-III synthase [Desulfurobacterium pacificum]|uniref:Uroporphyrinogen-III synthase n=1 Tax=Desulfurobacterium pacificum TaxID=240166 RepID=A0ABY1NYA8_9BACT|nr:uroporphyrinogen-III synthase [Desulfurobacterium pacificum]SMP19061.1 uroporphyrinogen-III synthase [Desulfurobacterium pacificum]